MTQVTEFADFYRAVHDRDPFPWQARLANLVVSQGWPGEIGVPTGLGKTSALDIAVWALAAQADLPPRERTAPTRVWYVVNRRLLVDAATTHARRLAHLLNTTNDGPIGKVAALLRVVEGGITSQALTVSRFRGGALDGRPAHAAQPAILCATVPMFASRLLFRSYGASNRMWPIDAALAGVDSLVLLDEAHLSPTLRDLVADLQMCDANRAGVLRAPGSWTGTPGPNGLLGPLRAYPQLVSLTATGAANGDRFDLDDADLAHPVVARRLSARKRCTVERTTAKDLPSRFATEIRRAVEAVPTGAVLAVVNRPATARSVAAATQALVGKTTDLDLVVLTGQLREPDADAVRTRLLDPSTGMPAGAPVRRLRPLVVVATQTLEVGADIDADHLVTEAAGVRALVQRLGRLNRLGLSDSATAVVLHAFDAPSPLYGGEVEEVVRRLEAAGEEVDLCPAAVAGVLGPPADTSPPAPALLPAHLWEWAKTSLVVRDAAPIELFYDGFDAPDLTVSFAWRDVLGQPGSALYPALDSQELVEVPLSEARAFLQQTPVLTIGDDGATLAEVLPDDLRPGARVVLPSVRGGYGDFGWDPASTSTVRDLSPLVAGAVPLAYGTLVRLAARELTDDEQSALFELLEEPLLEDPVEHSLGSVLWSAIEAAVAGVSPGARFVGVDRVGDDASPWLRWTVDASRSAVAVDASRSAVAVDAFDELSIAPTAELDVHLGHVGAMAERIAAAVGLRPELARALGRAGLYHDMGKADPRFQRWLGSPPGVLRAKSRMVPGRWRQRRIAAGWPTGARHELLSVQMLAAGGLDDDEAELIQHLVLSHHGNGRPYVPLAADDGAQAGVRFSGSVAGMAVDVELDPSQPVLDHPGRFRALTERFGHWGLAYLETIVRQADHLVSAVTEVQ